MFNRKETQKSFSDIRNLVKNESDSNRFITNESTEDLMLENVEPTMHEKMHILALDLMHELVARKRNESFGEPDIDKIAEMVALQYSGVDAGALVRDYYDEEKDDDYDEDDDYDDDEYYDDDDSSIDYGFNPTAQAVRNEERQIFNEGSYKEREMALTQLHFIKYAAEEVIDCMESGMEIPEWYQNKITEAHYEMKDIHSYMEGKKSKEMKNRVDMMMDRGYMGYGKQYDSVKNWNNTVEETNESIINEVLDPKAPLETWIKDFVHSDNKRFKGKSKKERIEMAKGAYYSARRKAGISEEDGTQSESLEKDSDDPCWKGYVQVGTKMKNGKEVPNCVPMKNEETEVSDDEFDSVMASMINGDMADDFIKAVEDKDRSEMMSMISKKAKKNKAKKIVDRILDSQ